MDRYFCCISGFEPRDWEGRGFKGTDGYGDSVHVYLRKMRFVACRFSCPVCPVDWAECGITTCVSWYYVNGVQNPERWFCSISVFEPRV